VGGPVGDALVLTLGTPPTTFTVVKTSATLGRGQENTIRLDDLSVSRHHARIAYRQGGYWLSDLGSMGGTWVDGTRLNAPRRIAFGEVIDIGLCRLTVSFAGDAAKAEKKSASKPPSEVTAQVRRRR
jgi:pSer/pThr/pTyr-binding forkhead associated (FHA) protein